MPWGYNRRFETGVITMGMMGWIMGLFAVWMMFFGGSMFSGSSLFMR